MRDCPSPEYGIFYILIIDLISKRALVLFSLLCEINYHYNKGPIIVENITILTIHGGLCFIIFLHSISLRRVNNIILFLLTLLFVKMNIMNHCILNYNDIPIFVMFQIKISSIIIFHKYQIYDFLVFCVTIFRGISRIPYISLFDFDQQNQASLAICCS